MDDIFYVGVLACLHVLRSYDSHVVGCEIVETIGGLDKLEEIAKRAGSECDLETISWLKTGES